jgi:hypothetical protein
MQIQITSPGQEWRKILITFPGQEWNTDPEDEESGKNLEKSWKKQKWTVLDRGI